MERDTRFSVPLFTVEEAAHHLGLPRSTLRSWVTSMAGPDPLVHRLNPETPRGASVPFIAMAEAHVLRALRNLGLKPREIRESVGRLRRELRTEYALASRRIASDGVTVLVDMADSFEQPRWERARDGQRVIDEVIHDYLRFITWSETDEYPTRLKLRAYKGADVIIDPRFGFGQPVLEGPKIRIEDILDAFWAGESSWTIADEFGISAEEVEATVRAATRPRAA